jgi:hypothetical protein
MAIVAFIAWTVQSMPARGCALASVACKHAHVEVTMSFALCMLPSAKRRLVVEARQMKARPCGLVCRFQRHGNQCVANLGFETCAWKQISKFKSEFSKSEMKTCAATQKDCNHNAATYANPYRSTDHDWLRVLSDNGVPTHLKISRTK